MTAVAGFRDLITRNVRQSGIFIAFVAIVILFSVLNSSFLSPGNLTNIVLQYSYVLILATGMLMVIVLGQIDLSVGSVVALTGAVAAEVVIKGHAPWFVGVLVALVVGFAVGCWQGFWVAWVGIPGFIVTLAGMLLFRGLTYIVLNSISLSPFNGTYYKIANGFLNGQATFPYVLNLSSLTGPAIADLLNVTVVANFPLDGILHPPGYYPVTTTVTALGGTVLPPVAINLGVASTPAADPGTAPTTPKTPAKTSAATQTKGTGHQR